MIIHHSMIKRGSIFPKTFMARACFPMFPSFQHGKYIFQCQYFCFRDANLYAYATRQGILTKIRACEHQQNFCEHEHEQAIASNSSKGQILPAVSNWMGPFDTPIYHSTSLLSCGSKIRNNSHETCVFLLKVMRAVSLLVESPFTQILEF